MQHRAPIPGPGPCPRPPRTAPSHLGWLLLGLFWLTLLLAGAAPSQAQEPPPLLVGGTVSLEGRFKDTSLQMQHAMRLWERQVNQRGGLLGRRVRLLLHDDKSDPGLARQLYARLLDQDKVDLLAAPYGSVLTMASSEASEPRGFVTVATASGEELWQRGQRNLFGVYATADRYFIGFMDLLARQGFEDVAVLHAGDAFSRSAARGCREWAERLGLRAVLTLGYQDAAQEMPALLEQLRQVRPQGLVLCSYPPDAFRLLDLMRQAGYRPPALAMAVAPAMPDFGERVGDQAEGVMGPSQWESDERLPYPGTRRFIQDFCSQTGLAPSYHAASAYASLTLLENAVRHTQSLDQEKIREYLLDLDSMTILGRFKVDRQGRQIGHSPFIVQWQKGQKEIIYPPRMRTTPAILPPAPVGTRQP
ncbi:MAG: amino acid ABC transporter substrate-binding protein [Desulfarculus sp.]|nr:amino acid ABC transporter substrate-binding protein [Desulfarculus sp.]